LAGALARPTWTVLKAVPDWRWMLDREDSPWYPTMRLFRQETPGDWKTVFGRIEGELKPLLKGVKRYRKSNSPGRSHARKSNPTDLKEAIAPAQAGRLDEAEKITRLALDANPTDFGGLQLLGLIAFQRGNYDAALVHMDEAIRIKGDVCEVFCNRGL